MNRSSQILTLLLISTFASAGSAAPFRKSDKLESRLQVSESRKDAPNVKWWRIEHPDGVITLNASIGQHYTFESAWAHYAQLFGLDPRYRSASRHQERIVDGRAVSVKEHARDHIFRAGRWARMDGYIDGRSVHVSLFDEPDKGDMKRVSVHVRIKPRGR